MIITKKNYYKTTNKPFKSKLKKNDGKVNWVITIFIIKWSSIKSIKLEKKRSKINMVKKTISPLKANSS
jgi:hypothetical protein